MWTGSVQNISRDHSWSYLQGGIHCAFRIKLRIVKPRIVVGDHTEATDDNPLGSLRCVMGHVSVGRKKIKAVSVYLHDVRDVPNSVLWCRALQATTIVRPKVQQSWTCPILAGLGLWHARQSIQAKEGVPADFCFIYRWLVISKTMLIVPSNNFI